MSTKPVAFFTIPHVLLLNPAGTPVELTETPQSIGVPTLCHLQIQKNDPVLIQVVADVDVDLGATGNIGIVIRNSDGVAVQICDVDFDSMDFVTSQWVMVGDNVEIPMDDFDEVTLESVITGNGLVHIQRIEVRVRYGIMTIE